MRVGFEASFSFFTFLNIMPSYRIKAVPVIIFQSHETHQLSIQYYAINMDKRSNLNDTLLLLWNCLWISDCASMCWSMFRIRGRPGFFLHRLSVYENPPCALVCAWMQCRAEVINLFDGYGGLRISHLADLAKPTFSIIIIIITLSPYPLLDPTILSPLSLLWVLNFCRSSSCLRRYSFLSISLALPFRTTATATLIWTNSSLWN